MYYKLVVGVDTLSELGMLNGTPLQAHITVPLEGQCLQTFTLSQLANSEARSNCIKALQLERRRLACHPAMLMAAIARLPPRSREAI